MWRPVEEPWQYRLLDAAPSSLDLAQLERTLKMSPGERIDAMQSMMRLAFELRRNLRPAKGHR